MYLRTTLGLGQAHRVQDPDLSSSFTAADALNEEQAQVDQNQHPCQDRGP